MQVMVKGGIAPLSSPPAIATVEPSGATYQGAATAAKISNTTCLCYFKSFARTDIIYHWLHLFFHLRQELSHLWCSIIQDRVAGSTFLLLHSAQRHSVTMKLKFPENIYLCPDAATSLCAIAIPPHYNMGCSEILRRSWWSQVESCAALNHLHWLCFLCFFTMFLRMPWWSI